MSLKDPHGGVYQLIRDNQAVSAIAGTRIGSELPTRQGKPLVPCVVLESQTDSRFPFGPGSGRVGLQRWFGVAKCYGTKDATGPITARQLAGAVSDGLHLHAPVTVGQTYFAQIFAGEIGGRLTDPDTGLPYFTVRIDAIAGAQAVA